MALKDWRLIGENLGKNKDIIQLDNDKNGSVITHRKGWDNVHIRVPYDTLFGWFLSHDADIKFKTEKAKLKYIKSYMRTH